jgi:hypothetical protein
VFWGGATERHAAELTKRVSRQSTATKLESVRFMVSVERHEKKAVIQMKV